MRRSITPPRSDGRVSPPFTSTTTMPGYAPTRALEPPACRRPRPRAGARVPWIPDEREEVVSGLGGRYGSQSSSPVPRDNDFVVDIMRKTVEELKHLHYPGQPDPSPPPAAAYPAAAYSPGGSSMTRPPPPPTSPSGRSTKYSGGGWPGRRRCQSRGRGGGGRHVGALRVLYDAPGAPARGRPAQGRRRRGGGGVRELPPSPGMHPPPHAVSRAGPQRAPGTQRGRAEEARRLQPAA